MNVKKKVVELIKFRFGDNLAGIIVFGSYATGNYDSNESDFDTLIYLKRKTKSKLEGESKTLAGSGKEIKLSVQRLSTLKQAYKRIYGGGRWSGWLTTITYPHIYSTPEFERFIKKLKKRPLNKRKVIEYIKEKDRVLDKAFKELNGWRLTKTFYAHLRRKLQVLHYYKTKDPKYKFEDCLNDTEFKDKEFLNKISETYMSRKILNGRDLKTGYEAEKQMTEEIKNLLSD